MKLENAVVVLCAAWVAAACGEVTVKDGVPAKTKDKDGGSSSSDTIDKDGEEKAGADNPLSGDHPSGDFVVKGCPDGDYAEALPDLGASIKDLVDGYDAGEAETYVMAAMERRYPTGKDLVGHIRDDGQCDGFFKELGKGSFEDLDFLTILVHECGHLLNAKLSPAFGQDGFFLTEASQFVCTDGPEMERGKILEDDLADKIPSCESAGGDGTCDTYRETYLGELGSQNFGDLMDEQTEYVHTLATGYAFSDQIPENQAASHRDGLLAFLWYMQRYLKVARTDYPDEYAKVSGSDCWRKFVLTNWGRAWLYLGKTEKMSNLEIHGAAFYDQVTKPDMLAEIDALRTASSCGK